MPISVARAQRHSAEWSKQLAPFQTRANWPPHLFHTCQLAVAVEIVKSGAILSRNNVQDLICDVANQGALWNNPHAHEYVRLYFRPRNSFHLKTEGIKAVGDPYRVDPHMSIPIAFAFDFQQVMIKPNSAFVPGNFARTGAAPLTGDAEFDKLPFHLIYHDSALGPDRITEVHNWRMSEVVVRGDLDLSSLSYVICRTTHDERTLRHALKGYVVPTIIVEQRGSIFMRRGIFIDEIYWASNMLHAQFHGPTGFTKEKYELKITCWDDGKRSENSYSVAPGRYYFSSMPASRNAIWRIDLEGCIAYHATVPSTSGLVVS